MNIYEHVRASKAIIGTCALCSRHPAISSHRKVARCSKTWTPPRKIRSPGSKQRNTSGKQTKTNEKLRSPGALGPRDLVSALALYCTTVSSLLIVLLSNCPELL